MSLTKVSYSMIEGAAFNVIDFGADPTGSASSVSAFNAALANGGLVYVPSGTYELDNTVTMSVDNTTLMLAADVTLLMSGITPPLSIFDYAANQIVVTGNDCAIIGSGYSSLMQLTNGTYGNPIQLWQSSGFTLRDIALDGDKNNVTATTNDGYGMGFYAVQYNPDAPLSARILIDGCSFTNFIQYGIGFYGDQCTDIRITNCIISDCGKTSDTESVGAGIVCTQQVGYIQICNNVIKRNKDKGIFVAPGNLPGTPGNYLIANNIVQANGNSGIAFTAQPSYGSVAGIGISQITITGNTCAGNTKHGIVLSTTDDVGYYQYIAITGNVCNSNTEFGIYLESNASPNNIDSICVSGNLLENNLVQNIFITSGITRGEGILMPFTPRIEGSTTAGTGTYVAQLGTYVRNGNLVNFQLVLEWSNHTGTGNILLAGLPFNIRNAEPQPTLWVWSNGLSITGQAAITLLGNTSTGRLEQLNNGSFSVVPMDTAAALRITGSYFIDY